MRRSARDVILAMATLAVIAGCDPSSAPSSERQAGSALPPHCKGTAGLECEAFGFDGGEARCAPDGTVDITRCISTSTRTELAQGTPPGGHPAEPPATCGNGKIDLVEEQDCPCIPGRPCHCQKVTRKAEPCDGAQLDGNSCDSLGYLGGQLACTERCGLDTIACVREAPGVAALHVATINGLGYYGPGAVPAAIAAIRGAVAAAWIIPRPHASDYDVVFAWSDPSMTALRTGRPFSGGYAADLQLSGNEAGWLLAISTYGDEPAIRVVPIDTWGHVGTPGEPVAYRTLLFIVRGARGERSLVGGARALSDHRTTLDGWFVNDAGQPVGDPFELGVAAQYAAYGARAAHLGGGRFAVAVGTAHDAAVKLLLVDGKGEPTRVAISGADPHGLPLALLATPDRIDLAYASGKPGTSTIAFTPAGAMLEQLRIASPDPAVGYVGGTRLPALVTSSGSRLHMHMRGEPPRALLGGPGMVAMVASAPDGAYALVSMSDSGLLARLR